MNTHRRLLRLCMPLLWMGLAAGVLLGACGVCAGMYIARHVDVSVKVK